MALRTKFSTRTATQFFGRYCKGTAHLRTARIPYPGAKRFLSQYSYEERMELFEYTSGRWLWNDALKHSERRRVFDVSEFKRLAAAAVDQDVEDVASFTKLAEGGFNRAFLITMRDGLQFVGRIPYPTTQPRHLVVASEVATMDFLRSRGIPVPKIYSYSATSENAAGTEYIFLELVRGTNLGDIWFNLSEKARITVLDEMVRLESRLFALEFPAYGSLYYKKDLQAAGRQTGIPLTNPACNGEFCIGPDTRLGLWHGKRMEVEVDRGPYADPVAVLTAGARKEIAYLTKFGRPLHPFQRLQREIYDYQKQSPLDHLDNLNKYLRVAPNLIPHHDKNLTRPTLRHLDLQPNNVFVSESLEVTGLIDWQHCTILPLFLQCGIPNNLQNYGDDISESLAVPRLPDNFDELGETEQYEQVMPLRRRQLHYFYVTMTEKLNPIHYDALTCDFSVLRRKIFDHASYPWEGDNISLKADLIHLKNNWSTIAAPQPDSEGNAEAACPISFTRDEIIECEHLHAAQIDADEQLQTCRDVVGVGPEGWVPLDQYTETKHRANKLKADALEAAESEEERNRLIEHWIFDDFDEDEYS